MNKGKKLSKETRRKISETKKSQILAEEQRKKQSEIMEGENNPWYGTKSHRRVKKKIT